jgi:hypothetical protein
MDVLCVAAGVSFLFIPNQLREGAAKWEKDPAARAAYNACQVYVRERLLAPITADFAVHDSVIVKLHGYQRYEIDSYVEADSKNGGRVRNYFTCIVQGYGPDWHLVYLETE